MTINGKYSLKITCDHDYRKSNMYHGASRFACIQQALDDGWILFDDKGTTFHKTNPPPKSLILSLSSIGNNWSAKQHIGKAHSCHK